MGELIIVTGDTVQHWNYFFQNTFVLFCNTKYPRQSGMLYAVL